MPLGVSPPALAIPLIFASSLFGQAANLEETKPTAATESQPARPDGTAPRLTSFTADLIEQGKHSVNAFCGRCHGRDGRGAKGPDLTDGIYLRGPMTDQEIVDIIANGRSGTGMIGFGADYEDYYLPVVAYIRSEEAKARGKPQEPKGDIARGEAIFKQQRCGGCHWLNQSGGRLGTDLTHLAATANFIRQKILSPDQEIDRLHQKVVLLHSNDQVTSGKRLRETEHDILIIDDQENLRSIRKADLEGVRYSSKSIMPSYKDALSQQEIEDLTAYLVSLQQKPAQ